MSEIESVIVTLKCFCSVLDDENDTQYYFREQLLLSAEEAKPSGFIKEEAGPLLTYFFNFQEHI